MSGIELNAIFLEAYFNSTVDTAQKTQACLMKKASGRLFTSFFHQGGAAKETLAILMEGERIFLSFCASFDDRHLLALFFQSSFFFFFLEVQNLRPRSVSPLKIHRL